MLPSILQRGHPSCLFFWWHFWCIAKFREVFSSFWDILFLFFHLSCLIWLYLIHSISQVLVVFLLSRVSTLSWFGCSIPPAVAFFYPFPYQHGPFFYTKFYCYIFAVCYWLSKGVQLFDIFLNILFFSHVHKMIHLLLWFYKFVATCVLSS